MRPEHIKSSGVHLNYTGTGLSFMYSREYIKSSGVHLNYTGTGLSYMYKNVGVQVT